MSHPRILHALALLLPLLLISPAGAAADDSVSRVRRLLEALVAADTTNPPGNETRATAIVARRLDEAGIPYERLAYEKGRENLIARIAGTGDAEPLLIVAHLDVVGAEEQAWTFDPHIVTEKDGFLYGRGVLDDLGMAAIAVETLVRLREEQTPLARDVILALTADEESGSGGAEHLVANHFEKIRSGVAINEGGGIILAADGSPKLVSLQVAEKTYEDFRVSAKGPSGHSSVPLDDNAIVRLSRALTRIGRLRFPPRLLPVTRAWLAARAEREAEPLAGALRAVAASEGKPPPEAVSIVDHEPELAAMLRTTCVATLVEGGTRVNALPAEATANVNCRILPSETIGTTKTMLVEAIGDPEITVTAVRNSVAAPASPLVGPGIEAIRRVLGKAFPGVPIVPSLSLGATDSRTLRPKGISVYGFNPIATTEADRRRMHGIDERVSVESFSAATNLFHRLVLEVASP